MSRQSSVGDQSVMHLSSTHGPAASHGEHTGPLNGGFSGLNGGLHGLNGSLHGLNGGLNGSMHKINGLVNGLHGYHGKGGSRDHGLDLAQPMELSIPPGPTQGLDSEPSPSLSPTLSATGSVPCASPGTTSATADPTVTAMLISMSGINGISPTVSDMAGMNGVPLPRIPHTLVKDVVMSGVGALDVQTVAATMDSSKRRRLTADERLQRSRERNRIHAKKTRLRKKQKMEDLQQRKAELQQEQHRLQETIKDRETAPILLDMRNSVNGLYNGKNSSSPHDHTEVSQMTTTNVAEHNSIMKAREKADQKKQHSGLSGLDPHSESESDDTSDESAPSRDPAAMDVDGSHNSKASSSISSSTSTSGGTNISSNFRPTRPMDPEQQRRERNRMHAKRTRDRKKILQEETETEIMRLEQENANLRDLICRLGTTGGHDTGRLNGRHGAEVAPTGDRKRPADAMVDDDRTAASGGGSKGCKASRDGSEKKRERGSSPDSNSDSGDSNADSNTSGETRTHTSSASTPQGSLGDYNGADGSSNGSDGTSFSHPFNPDDSSLTTTATSNSSGSSNGTGSGPGSDSGSNGYGSGSHRNGDGSSGYGSNGSANGDNGAGGGSSDGDHEAGSGGRGGGSSDGNSDNGDGESNNSDNGDGESPVSADAMEDDGGDSPQESVRNSSGNSGSEGEGDVSS